MCLCGDARQSTILQRKFRAMDEPVQYQHIIYSLCDGGFPRTLSQSQPSRRGLECECHQHHLNLGACQGCSTSCKHCVPIRHGAKVERILSQFAYNASKAAADHLTRMLATELALKNIKVRGTQLSLQGFSFLTTHCWFVTVWNSECCRRVLGKETRIISLLTSCFSARIVPHGDDRERRR
jgi:hypothetical protein